MAAERLPMRKVPEVLRLKYACGVSERVIARSVVSADRRWRNTCVERL